MFGSQSVTMFRYAALVLAFINIIYGAFIDFRVYEPDRKELGDHQQIFGRMGGKKKLSPYGILGICLLIAAFVLGGIAEFLSDKETTRSVAEVARGIVTNAKDVTVEFISADQAPAPEPYITSITVPNATMPPYPLQIDVPKGQHLIQVTAVPFANLQNFGSLQLVIPCIKSDNTVNLTAQLVKPGAQVRIRYAIKSQYGSRSASVQSACM
jgi:hypothetical protein